jgi:hypothetical protein
VDILLKVLIYIITVLTPVSVILVVLTPIVGTDPTEDVTLPVVSLIV